MSEYVLTKHLLALSRSDNWDEAKNEWDYTDVEQNNEGETCPCGQYPIKEVCTIENKITGKSARIGNSCVKKFDNRPDKIFQAIRRIGAENSKQINSETLAYARQKNWLNEWEYNFSLNTLRKRNLSPKQLDLRIKINKVILNRFNHK